MNSHPYRDQISVPSDSPPAERLCVSDYAVYRTRPSAYDSQREIKALVGYVCPRCRTRFETHHADGNFRHVCGHCGLEMESSGNILLVFGRDRRL